MTDLDMTRRCAKAVGLGVPFKCGDDYLIYNGSGVVDDLIYQPLKNDEQAMELIKKFHLTISRGLDGWSANYAATGWVSNADLNRAIVECVARLTEWSLT